MVVIPDNSAMHVVGKGGKGLKQVHDIFDARVHAYALAIGSHNKHHISIWDTDLQIRDALVVLGKHVAHKQVHPPKMKKTKDAPSTHAHLPHSMFPKQLTMMLPLSSCPTGPSTSGLVEVPTMEEDSKSNIDSSDTAPIPSVQMASPLPPPTPIIPSVSMRFFSLTMPEAVDWSCMEVDSMLIYAQWPNAPTNLELCLPWTWSLKVNHSILVLSPQDKAFPQLVIQDTDPPLQGPG